jgi:hypothetical protein
VDAVRSGAQPGTGRLTGYLLMWPGTDALAFFSRTRKPVTLSSSEWVVALMNSGLGIVLVYWGAPVALPVSRLLSGWVGMIGIVLALHFGLFKIIALAWRKAGIDATPLMEAPVKSRSLSEFWSRRWNTGFSVPARRYLMVPLARRIGMVGAIIVVFIASGILHELVISLPARWGYGLPTLYFLFQGLGMLFERSRTGRWMRLGSGWRGRVFTIVWTAGPAFWLFPAPFVDRVILPFLQSIKALNGV